MAEPRFVSELFVDRPQRWGLRGDPPLWDALLQHFAGITIPCSAADLSALVEAAFESLTQHAIAETQPFYIEKYARGGMSNGMVSPEFWRQHGLPLILARQGRALASRFW